MAANAIPGFEEAVEFERNARNGVYLPGHETICGRKVNDITPATLAILTEAKSPFLLGGDFSIFHVAQFIVILQGNPDKEQVLLSLGQWSMDDAQAEIAEFLDLTFLDAPGGVSEGSAPIASSSAWFEYRMLCEPFRWDYETKTSKTPIRRIYQLLRCQDRERGLAVINNHSGRVEGDWLVLVNAGMADGSITPDMLREAQERAVYRLEGKEYPGFVPTPGAPKNEDQFKVIGGGK